MREGCGAPGGGEEAFAGGWWPGELCACACRGGPLGDRELGGEETGPS